MEEFMDKELIENLIKKTDEIENPNSHEAADLHRELLLAAYESNHGYIMESFEDDWKKLEKKYEVINRNEHVGRDPLASFMYYVDGGFYPPPEILQCLEKCFRKYWDESGKYSLDEIFFGQKHKRWDNPSYWRSLDHKYSFFDSFWVRGRESPKVKVSFKNNEDAAEDFLNSPFGHELKGTDVDTFLRGYRRWKLKLQGVIDDKE
jgi:hypothetical protein